MPGTRPAVELKADNLRESRPLCKPGCRFNPSFVAEKTPDRIGPWRPGRRNDRWQMPPSRNFRLPCSAEAAHGPGGRCRATGRKAASAEVNDRDRPTEGRQRSDNPPTLQRPAARCEASRAGTTELHGSRKKWTRPRKISDFAAHDLLTMRRAPLFLVEWREGGRGAPQGVETSRGQPLEMGEHEH